jgi:ADP-ribosylglycohydrolase
MPIPHDYAERVYAGILGKIIGVYLGRPFEGWTYKRIMAELGEVTYYVHERLGKPLIVPDDDISGTFTFLRALGDRGNDPGLTPAQIGESWLNYLIEGRTILWWGGLGNSTEHTAYLRLKAGIPAPASGASALNGPIVAEQIGAQIFVDGWAMVAPGDPALAADFARRAASVSHDGAAIHGAQVLAAMEAAAFGEPDLGALLDLAVSFIPPDSIIRRLIDDVRDWHAGEPDWRRTHERIAARYGYDKYPGNCHMVPNHALIILGLLYGGDDFGRALAITNTAGWDTDCNAGNVGGLLGIKNGLAGLDAGADWRGPVADRLYLSAAEGGRAITDAVAETFHVVNSGRALAGLGPVAPKGGARFHFDLPGATQGFRPEESPEARGVLTLENVAGHSRLGGRSLALRYRGLATGRAARAATPTFIPPAALAREGYDLLASPTLHPGQIVRARVGADAANSGPVSCRLYLRHYGADDLLHRVADVATALAPGDERDLVWRTPDLGGQPIAEIGVELVPPDAGRADGTLYLDALTWGGAPEVTLGRPVAGGTLWRRAWVNGVDQFDARWPEDYRIVHNHGIGLLMQGSQGWADYHVTATLTPHLATSAGLAARVGGLRRYYALLLGRDGDARLIKVADGTRILAERPFPWTFGATYEFGLTVAGSRISGWLDGQLLLEADDTNEPLVGGGVALVCEEGCLGSGPVRVRSVARMGTADR